MKKQGGVILWIRVLVEKIPCGVFQKYFFREKIGVNIRFLNDFYRKKFGYEIICSLFFVFLFGFLDLFRQITFTVAVHFRTFFVNTVISDDVFFPEFVIDKENRSHEHLECHGDHECNPDYFFCQFHLLHKCKPRF
jgi:hypothetical protein